MAKSCLALVHYGEDAGESRFVLEALTREELINKVQELSDEMCYSDCHAFGPPTSQRIFHKVTYSWGQTVYRL